MELSQSGDVVLLRMNAGKANSMSERMLGDLSRLVAEAPPGPLVITGYQGFFSGGLALPSLIELRRDEMRAFIGRFARVMRQLYVLERPVVAAVNGHAIAGGCVLALMADVRIMAQGKAKIGLNEVALGIGLPAIVLEALRAQVPPWALLPIAMEGKLLPPDDALRLQLIHEVVAAEDLEPRAIARARELAAIPAPAFAQVKQAVRLPSIERMDRLAAEETERWLDTWYSPSGQERLRATVARLTTQGTGPGGPKG